MKQDVNVNIVNNESKEGCPDNTEFNLSDGIQTADEAQYDLEVKKMSSRKKMAWFSLVGIIGVLVGAFLMYFVGEFNPDRFNAIRPLIEMCVFSLTSVVGFFIGSQTFADSKWSKDNADNS